MRPLRSLDRDSVYVRLHDGYYKVPAAEVKMLEDGFMPRHAVRVTDGEFCSAVRAVMMARGRNIVRFEGCPL